MKESNKTTEKSLLSAYYDSELSAEESAKIEELLKLQPELAGYFKELELLGDSVRDFSSESFELAFRDYEQGEVWSSIEGRLEEHEELSSTSGHSRDSLEVTPPEGFFSALFGQRPSLFPGAVAFASLAALAVWFSSEQFSSQTNQEIIQVAKEDAIEGRALPKISRDESMLTVPQEPQLGKLEDGQIEVGGGLVASQVDTGRTLAAQNLGGQLAAVNESTRVLVTNDKPVSSLVTLAGNSTASAKIDWLQTSRDYKVKVLVDGQGSVAPVIWLNRR